MDVMLLVPLVIIAFLLLLVAGRAQLVKGAGVAVANGALLLVLAQLMGLLALGLVVSLDVW